MHTIVCVKQVLDPEIPPAKFKIDPEAKKVIPPAGVPPVISVFDERAVEAACRLKDKHKGKITVISMGSGKASDVVKHAISMGADDGFVLQDEAFENLDSFGTAYVLGKAIQKIGGYDLVLCGRQAADWGAGQGGSILAEILGIPVVTLACNIEAVDKKLRVKRMVKDGYEVLDAPMLFFFQAEDGIRDDLVTGVQTCALPISGVRLPGAPGRLLLWRRRRRS